MGIHLAFTKYHKVEQYGYKKTDVGHWYLQIRHGNQLKEAWFTVKPTKRQIRKAKRTIVPSYLAAL